MSDDLSPVEQARAARWIDALMAYAGKLDPPELAPAQLHREDQPETGRGISSVFETVESLREALLGEHDAWLSAENALHGMTAERDLLRDERDAAASDVKYWREQFRLVCDESKERKAERDKALTNAKTWEDLADGWRDRAIELRGDVREAEAIIARLRATHTEAARGRCQRED